LRISEDNIGIDGNLVFYKDGPDSSSYNFIEVTKPFSVGAKDSTPPDVIDYKVTKLAKTEATINIVMNEASKIYFMLSRYGTPSPTIEEFIN